MTEGQTMSSWRKHNEPMSEDDLRKQRCEYAACEILDFISPALFRSGAKAKFVTEMVARVVYRRVCIEMGKAPDNNDSYWTEEQRRSMMGGSWQE